jgi:D-alanine-D-alanine ligase
MKKKIGVLFGSDSTEHEISIKSTEFIFRTLDQNKYDLKLIYLDKKNNWFVPKNFQNKFPNLGEIFKTEQEKISANFLKEFSSLNEIEEFNLDKVLNEIDLFFLGLHGGIGENGLLQAFFEFHKKPYTGSNFASSSLAMDKEKSNLIFQAKGFNVAKFINLEKKDLSKKQINLNYPLFIKPNRGGSSVGVSKIKSKDELYSKLNFLFETEKEILVQEFISGIEVSCGVLENRNGELIQLYPTEIIPENEFFDYEAKYILGKSNEITPARISEKLTNEIRDLAQKAHKVLGCSAYSRTDFIIQNDIPFILETNTLPGMTETSLIPAQAKYSGLNMSDIFDDIIFLALK